jgi:hypothetical protein
MSRRWCQYRQTSRVKAAKCPGFSAITFSYVLTASLRNMQIVNQHTHRSLQRTARNAPGLADARNRPEKAAPELPAHA